jgi:hypothetical protein
MIRKVVFTQFPNLVGQMMLLMLSLRIRLLRIPLFTNFFTFFNFTVHFYVGNVVTVVNVSLSFGKIAGFLQKFDLKIGYSIL